MKIIKRVLLVLVLTATLGLFLTAKTTPISAAEINDDRQFKGVWLSSLIGELPYLNEAQYKATMNEAFDVMEHYGYNALIFHVRTHNNAFYPSELNPLASWFKDVNFDVFDPLEWTINESHKRGIEFHAWLNPYRVNQTYIVGEYPENNPASKSSNLLTNSHGEIILNPALPHVREHIFDTITELIEAYDVDAIHFDDYFYIRESTQYEPKSADGKRREIDLLIEGISDLLKAYNRENNKAVQFGISPSGVYRSGDGVVTYEEDGTPISNGSATTTTFIHYGDYLYADTIKWSVEGWIDYIVPQLYWARNHPSASFLALSEWWDKMYKYLDVNLYLGIGVYQADEAGNTYGWKGDVNELYYQLNNAESKEHVGGYVLFSYKHLQNGYNKVKKMSATQVNLAYFDTGKADYKIPPIVRNMEPILLPNIRNIEFAEGVLSWDSLQGSKFYYIYKSKYGQPLTYDSSEIVGTMAHQSGKMNFDTNDTSGNYNYGVKAISRTNHFSGTAPDVEEETKQLSTMNKVTSFVKKGLRFSAKIEDEAKNNEHGFYVIYGEATTEQLKDILHLNNLTLNDKKVFKVKVDGINDKLNYSVILNGIPKSNYDNLITVISYVVDDNGNIVLSSPRVSSVTDALK